MFQRSGKQIKSQSPDSGVAGLRELKKKSIFNGCSPNFKIKHITFLRVRFQLLYIYDRNGTICPPLQSIKARLIRRRKFPLSLTGHTHMIKKKQKPVSTLPTFFPKTSIFISSGSHIGYLSSTVPQLSMAPLYPLFGIIKL